MKKTILFCVLAASFISVSLYAYTRPTKYLVFGDGKYAITGDGNYLVTSTASADTITVGTDLDFATLELAEAVTIPGDTIDCTAYTDTDAIAWATNGTDGNTITIDFGSATIPAGSSFTCNYCTLLEGDPGGNLTFGGDIDYFGMREE